MVLHFMRNQAMLELAKGNLLEANTEALVNAVNTEGVMGNGIALQFKKQYPDMFESYQRLPRRARYSRGNMSMNVVRCSILSTSASPIHAALGPLKCRGCF